VKTGVSGEGRRFFEDSFMINKNRAVQIVVFILLIGLQSYSYSSPDEVEKYTQQCKNFLNRHSGELNDESFEKLLGYIGNAQICKIDRIYNKLTEEEKSRLKDVLLHIEDVKKRLSREKRERINESIAAIMPTIENELWEALTKDELKELDILLRGKWNGMLKALEQNDIEKALSYFHHTASDRYRKTFKALKPEGRQKIGNDLANIQLVEVVMNTAIYEITSTLKKGEKFSFQLTFVKDLHGDWVIKSF
jgi:DNA-directed RNA polymerase subunit F